VEDPKDCWNYHPFNFPKTTNQGEDSPEEEDSPEGEDSPEEEDSLVAEDTQAEEEYHLEDHQEAVGDHRRCLCRKPLKGS